MGALEKIAYLKGLLDGLEVADESQKKIYAAIVESLDSLALELSDSLDRVEELSEMYEELSDDYSQLDEDLEALEEDFAKPFFMSIGFFRPHVPLYVPPKWFNLYDEKSFTLPNNPKSDIDDLPGNFLRISRAH